MSRVLALVIATASLILAGFANNTPAPAEATDTPACPPTETNCSVHPIFSSEPMTLFNFDGADTAPWSIENDGVMGGRSQGFVEVADGTLVFAGEVVTEGGGFTSVRAASQADLSGYDGIELRVRGGGRTFELNVDDGTRSRGREVNRRAPVPTSDSWEAVRVPFASLDESAHGEPVRVGPLDLSAVRSIGIYIIDGNDGPFRLEVDWIRAYRETE
jgi:NADH dehydrogenase [ubiquinone] 1 alpha subcomplex assembly factor 1